MCFKSSPGIATLLGGCKPSPHSPTPQSTVLQLAGTPRHRSSAPERRRRTSGHEGGPGEFQILWMHRSGCAPSTPAGSGVRCPQREGKDEAGWRPAPVCTGTCCRRPSSALQGAGVRQGAQGSCGRSLQHSPLAGKGGALAFLGSPGTGQKRLPAARPRLLYSRGCLCAGLS